MRTLGNIVLVCLAGALPLGAGPITVFYTVDLGGDNSDPLNGLAAEGTFTLNGTSLSVLLTNTSSGVPVDFDVASSLLVSVGMNLPGVDMLSGDAAVIGPGSVGLGVWSDRSAGGSVAEEWLWTNDYGGDFMETYRNVISTSNGQGGGTATRFDGECGGVDGPYGGMAAVPPVLQIPCSKYAVSNSIRFDVTLSASLTDAQLQAAANSSIVEYGSDARYLGVPEPASLALLSLAALFTRRPR
jgi:hypothetical protein